MQTFTDLVGAAVVPTHGFDATELTDLTPALDTAMTAHDTADQASEALGTSQLLAVVPLPLSWAPPLCPHTPLISLS